MARLRTTPIGEKNLKSQNAIFLWSFTAFNFVVFWSLLVNKQLAFASMERVWSHVTSKSGIMAAGIPIATIVLTGALDDVWKARLVFWRWRDPLPGCRVFTELVKTDPRINVAILKEKHGNLPRTPREQNALWYRLYRSHVGALQVWEGHRLYLLTRDMATLAAAFSLLFPISLLFVPISRELLLFYAASLVVQFMIVATSARNYGRRFVLNVLTEESQT